MNQRWRARRPTRTSRSHLWRIANREWKSLTSIGGNTRCWRYGSAIDWVHRKPLSFPDQATVVTHCMIQALLNPCALLDSLRVARHSRKRSKFHQGHQLCPVLPSIDRVDKVLMCRERMLSNRCHRHAPSYKRAQNAPGQRKASFHQHHGTFRHRDCSSEPTDGGGSLAW